MTTSSFEEPDRAGIEAALKRHAGVVAQAVSARQGVSPKTPERRSAASQAARLRSIAGGVIPREPPSQ